MTAPRDAADRRGAHLVVVGDALLDRDLRGHVERVAPDAPVPVVADPREERRPGGAALAAALARRDGVSVTLVAALDDGPAAARLRTELGHAGVSVVGLPTRGAIGEKARIHAGGQVLLRVDRGGDRTAPEAWTADAEAAVGAADAVLVACYGRGMTHAEDVRAAVAGAARRHVPVVWDPHPRGATPVPGVTLVTPNRSEAAGFCPDGVAGHAAPGAALLADTHARAAHLRDVWSAGGVCITLGADGALLVGGDGTPFMVPVGPAPTGPAPTGGSAPDTCGAGDRFASAAAVALARGALPSDAVIAAVAAAARFVAEGAAGAYRPAPPDRDWADGAPADGGWADDAPADGGWAGEAPADDAPADDAPAGDAPADGSGHGTLRTGEAAAAALIDRVQAAGGTVVATGGCFDLLHAGHVQMLRAARSMGDALVVCLNSDASVTRLKGPGRPVTGEEDRAAVLAGLDAVDAVVIFDEHTPEDLLERLRPDVWAKGADYAVADLPEAALVASWGGQAVVLPYLNGRSTTAILQEAHREQ